MIATNSTAVGGVGLPPKCDGCHEHHGLDISCAEFAKSKSQAALSALRPIATFNLQPVVHWVATDRHRMEVGVIESLEQLWTASDGQQQWRPVNIELYTADQLGPMQYEVYQNSTGELLGVYDTADEDTALLQAADVHHNVPIDDMFARITRAAKSKPPELVLGGFSL